MNHLFIPNQAFDGITTRKFTYYLFLVFNLSYCATTSLFNEVKNN